MKHMTCGRARRLTWQDPDALVLSVERAGAQAHIARCPECQRFLAEMGLFRRAVGAAGGTESAPPELHHRVQNALVVHRRHGARWRRARTGLGIAAALGIVLLGTRLLTRTESDPVLQIAAHEREWLTQPGIESSDQRAVHQWLAQRLRYEIHVPEFVDARLTGAAVLSIGGRPGAVIRFQIGDRHITYVIAPVESATGDSTLRPQRAGELAIVSWHMPGLLHVWIGAIPPEHLESLARRCAEQARAAGAISAAWQAAPFRA